jgi:hypothetical protein
MTWQKKLIKESKSKYNNQPVVVDGVKYDSRHEALRMGYLKLLERAGEIKDLRYHVEYELIPPIRKEVVCKNKKGTVYTRITNEPRVYEADFVYTIVSTGETVVEDFKGAETDLFLFKADLLYYKYGIKIKIVKQVNEPVLGNKSFNIK